MPDFSVMRYESVLRALDAELSAKGALRFRCGRFLLSARKQAA